MYRVDRRDFKIGDTLLPPTNSYHDADGFNSTIEKVLSQQMPAGKSAVRRTGLFIFSELSDAIRFSCNMTDSKIYKVESLLDTIFYHKGDMNWTEVMGKFSNNETVLKQLATLYWTDGCKTFKPCWEVLVNKMIVVSIIISNNDERKKMVSDFKMQASLNIEKLELYIDKLNGK